MNYRMTLYIIGQIFRVVGLFMLLPILVGYIYSENHVIASFGIPILILEAIILLFTIKKPKDKSIYSMEGFVSVAAAWITISAIGALPFVISGEILNFADAQLF